MEVLNITSREYRHNQTQARQRHAWTIKNDTLCIQYHVLVSNFHVGHSEYFEPVPNLELHWRAAPLYMNELEPTFTDCKTTGGNCWTDTSSHHAKETLWPVVEAYLRSRDQQLIFAYLESQMAKHVARERFSDVEVQAPDAQEVLNVGD